MILCTVIIPAMRAWRLAELLPNVAATAPHTEALVLATGEVADMARSLGARTVDDGGGTWAARINRGIQESDSPFVFTGADDVVFHPRWLEMALAMMPPKPGGVVVVNDLLNPAGTMALVAREYVTTFGDAEGTPGALCHTGYGHNYADTEMFDLADARGRLAYSPYSMVEHMHWTAGKSPNDKVYEQGRSTYGADADLYASRRHLWRRA